MSSNKAQNKEEYLGINSFDCTVTNTEIGLKLLSRLWTLLDCFQTGKGRCNIMDGRP